jgi:hypothetical protein
MSSYFMWDDAEFSSSLSEGMQAPKVVGLPLVEKVRVLRGYILFTSSEMERPFSPDLKNLGVRRSGTF